MAACSTIGLGAVTPLAFYMKNITSRIDRRQVSAWASYIGWGGSICMVLFAFTLLMPLAIVGLSMLTVQAVHEKMLNLVLLNLVSILGFLITGIMA